MSTQIVIVGYHRSGTSAIAQNCQAAGLYVGDDLLGATPTNPFGHYEDREFFEINELILRLNFSLWHTPIDFVPVLPCDVFKLASDMVSKRDAEHALWGFKDPRTCLLLDFWDSVLPDPRYLVCLRHYSACVDSVMRRRVRDYYAAVEPGPARIASEDMLNFNAICANWCVYMAGVLKFLTLRNPKALVIRVDRLVQNESVAARIGDQLGLDFAPITLGETFRPELFQGDEQPDLPLDPALREIAEALWQQLSVFESKG